jgi:hypothetical protein
VSDSRWQAGTKRGAQAPEGLLGGVIDVFAQYGVGLSTVEQICERRMEPARSVQPRLARRAGPGGVRAAPPAIFSPGCGEPSKGKRSPAHETLTTWSRSSWRPCPSKTCVPSHRRVHGTGPAQSAAARHPRRAGGTDRRGGAGLVVALRKRKEPRSQTPSHSGRPDPVHDDCAPSAPSNPKTQTSATVAPSWSCRS